jgi:hypothetical protein
MAKRRRKNRSLDWRIEHEPISVLQEEVSLRNRDDALNLIAGISRHAPPGCLTMVFIGRDHRFVDMLPVSDGGDNVRSVVELGCSIAPVAATGLLLVSNRTGEVPADRPDDELLWLELVQLANEQRITLYDWYVTCGTKAFSVAEFAPVPAQWAS